MEGAQFRLRVLWSLYIDAVLLLLCMNLLLEPTFATTTSTNESDRLALLSFKDRITQDPLGVMNSWNDSIHFCEWMGVSCSPSNERVVSLNLVNKKLVGSIPPSIGNLTLLTGINLSSNNFHGDSPQELGLLLRLQYLNLVYNSFTGMIPTNLTHCTELRILNLVYNDMVGDIPDKLSTLTKLYHLGLRGNNFTGRIPPWIGNISSLFLLSLAENNLQGNIPEEFGRLSSLGMLELFDNNLSGMIPSSIYNISSIYYITVTQNNLHGRFPKDLGFLLPNLKIFASGANSFTGPIPVSLSNISGLQIIDFSQNYRLTGPVPKNLGRLQSLSRLYFGYNQLGSGGELNDLNNLITSLTNCTSLQVLGLEYNLLRGEIPESIANLSTQLSILVIGGNAIYGNIPTGIENLVNLTTLGLEHNLLTGSIPVAIGGLKKLQRFHLNYNRFSGLIPSSFGNFSMLNYLFMEENSLEGSIPSSLGNCQNLLILNLSSNHFNGSIPKQIFDLSSLSISFAVKHNFLTGPLPLEVGNLKNLGELELSDNRFSGKIPSTMASCIKLERLYMGGNHFEGTIPQSLSTLRGIQELDLSSNNLSGQIPDYLDKFSSLKYLNLSFNDLEGEVPKGGIFSNSSAISVLGNYKLCGGIPKLQLPVCSEKTAHMSRRFLSPKVIVLITIGVLFVLLSCLLLGYWRRKMRNRTETSASAFKSWDSGISYAELFKSTGGFSKDNLIGVGSFGSVYKGAHNDDGSIIAVKVLNLQQLGASKSFIAEYETLRNIRHRNLVRIITTCSSVDFQGNDFKAIVFEMMPNGNLEQWLHPQVDGDFDMCKSLNLRQRLNIAIDVASALEYLHHHCETPIAHCDLKPSNVLLNKDMTAHVSDFGLAMFLLEKSNSSSENQTISNGLKGSIGYVAPEYGMGGQVSIYGDVYSYGILLLEMFTGKRPTGEMFKDGLSLHKFAMMGLPDRVAEVIDPLMFSAAENDDEEKEEEEVKNAREMEEIAFAVEEHNMTAFDSRIQECLASVIRVGVSCSMHSPSDRMVIKDVVNKLHDIRKSYLEYPGSRRRTK